VCVCVCVRHKTAESSCSAERARVITRNEDDDSLLCNDIFCDMRQKQ